MLCSVMYRWWFPILSVVPFVPTNLKLTRTDPVENQWVFTCTWKPPVIVAWDAYCAARVFYTEKMAAQNLPAKSD